MDKDGRVTHDGQQQWDPSAGPPAGRNPVPSAPGLTPPAHPPFHAAAYPPAVKVAPNGAPLASFGLRLAARIIDWLIVSAVYLVVTFSLRVAVLLVTRSTVAYRSNPDRFIGAFILFELALLALLALMVYLYEVELVLRRAGQSPGKRLMKLRITPLDPGRPLDRTALARRWGATLAIGLVPFGVLVDGLWQLWDQPYRQCLHDKAGGTVVVKVPG
jgi:uncharacterized RDD family membrane protein YckC